MVEGSSRPNMTAMEEIQLHANWDDVICPICLDFPHNAVLLQCSSFEKGCRSFVCNTDHMHSNCLDRFKQANRMSYGPQSSSSAEDLQFLDPGSESKPQCPLCRGEVTGWAVVNTARMHLDKKRRCCVEENCSFTGTLMELQNHAQLEHPLAHPSKIDLARQLDWENFQQSSEIIDVLSTIHSEVPHGVVLGDYVIDYGDDNSGDDFDDSPRGEGNWWMSCMVFGNFRTSRNRGRSRVSDSRRGSHRLSFDTLNSDEGSVSSVEHAEYRIRVNETVDEFMNARRQRAAQHSSQSRHSRFHGN